MATPEIAHPVYIFDPARGKPDENGNPRGETICVGTVEGRVFYKSIVTTKHILNNQNDLCFQGESLTEAQKLGADRVCLRDETGREYWAKIRSIWAYADDVNYGHGPQLGYPLAKFARSNRLLEEPQPKLF